MNRLSNRLVLAAGILVLPMLLSGNHEEAREWLLVAIRESGVTDVRVLAAMAAVRRDLFVPDTVRAAAWEDRALPIGYGQTISQPSLVARMNELLECTGAERVLEVGSGSGYHAATLAGLVREVYTIEIVAALHARTSRLFAELGITNVRFRHGNGYHGWEEEGPFDRIIVTAASDHVPPPLLRQLKPGGIMVIPVGNPLSFQNLLVLRKEDGGRIATRSVAAVRFVPLTGVPD